MSPDDLNAYDIGYARGYADGRATKYEWTLGYDVGYQEAYREVSRICADELGAFVRDRHSSEEHAAPISLCMDTLCYWYVSMTVGYAGCK